MFNKNLFAKKLDGLTPYIVDRGTYRARLDANESFIQLTAALREKFDNAVKDFQFNRYPDPDATELVKMFCKFYGLKRENVAVGNGSDEIISLIMNCFLDYGDAVMTLTPDFSMYAFYASLAGAKVIDCPKKSDYQVDFDKGKEYIKKNNVKLCVFSNPCNPTGKIEAKKNISDLAQSCQDTIFIVDEAYMDFAGVGKAESLLAETEKYTNIIVLKTLSKALGAASLRLGFIVCDATLANMFKAVKSPYNVNGVSQTFGKILLEDKQMLEDFTSRIIKSIKSIREMIIKENLGNPDETFTNFVFFADSKANEKWQFCRENGVLIRKFGIDGGALRITCGSDEENNLVIQALKKFGK